MTQKPAKLFQALVILLLCFPFVVPAATSDDFIRGYASALLAREFRLKSFFVNVAGETVTVTSGDLTEAKRITARSSLLYPRSMELSGLRSSIPVELKWPHRPRNHRQHSLLHYSSPSNLNTS
jgi:hypothetical protein